MRRTLWWLLFLVALVLYSLLVYNWWVEGNINRAKWEMEQLENESAVFRH